MNFVILAIEASRAGGQKVYGDTKIRKLKYICKVWHYGENSLLSPTQMLNSFWDRFWLANPKFQPIKIRENLKLQLALLLFIEDLSLDVR